MQEWRRGPAGFVGLSGHRKRCRFADDLVGGHAPIFRVEAGSRSDAADSGMRRGWEAKAFCISSGRGAENWFLHAGTDASAQDEYERRRIGGDGTARAENVPLQRRKNCRRNRLEASLDAAEIFRAVADSGYRRRPLIRPANAPISRIDKLNEAGSGTAT